jgi:protein ImuA
VAEFADTPDLTATRRLALAARDGGGIALLLRHKSSNAPSVARTRWQIAAAPSLPDEFGGLGRTAFTLSLTRNRRGPCGNWTLTWDQHEHAFSALSVGVDAAASDRPDRETLRTG